jgi:rhodanese-related sulfurtransferase
MDMGEIAGARASRGRGTLGGVGLILLTGLVLGVAYNVSQLRAERGLSWIAVDPLERLAAAPVVGAPSPEAASAASDDPLAPVLGASRASGADLPEIPAAGRPVQIQLDVLQRYHAAGAALIVDAREPDEYAEAHIPGAINLPWETAGSDPARLESLDSGGRPIVTYCGGGTCEVSLKLADELFYAGHPRVAVYVGGFPEWVEAGHPVASGSGEPAP